MMPGLVLFALFVLWPLVNVFINAFYSWNGLGPKVFVGWNNFIQIFQSSLFYSAAEHTVIYAVGTVLLKVVLAFGIALLVARAMKGIAIFRTILFIPVLMSFVAVGLLWNFVLDPNLGLLNSFLGMLHLPTTAGYLTDPKSALATLMFVDLWKWLGYHVVLFVAGLQMVRPELYEAAEVDGAGRWRQFWSVTVPSMRSIIVLNVIIAFAGGMNVFDLVYVMTKGGPMGSTQTMMTLVYQQAFATRHYGFASATAVVLFIVVGVLTLVQVRMMRSDYDE